MCGIFGQFNPRGADPALIERMARCLAHRGPDGYGTHHDKTRGVLAFGAGRLAIIDLAAPAGVIFSEDRHVSVVFNGEIYNHKTLRKELEAAGHRFATHTDTEVIVHGYEEWGLGVLERLRGMFALGLWDGSTLTLARDRLGEKPLYYAQHEGGLLFASEIKALFECRTLPRAVNTDAIPLYFALGYTPPPLTMFAGISKLAPGEFVQIGVGELGGELRKGTYWQPSANPISNHLSVEDAVREVRRAVTEAVEMRLMSDVPFGAFLSGGLDSSTVIAIMAQSEKRNQPLRTFTVGFADVGKEKFNDDAHYARIAVERYKPEHHAITIAPDERLAALLPHLIYALDEPVAEQAIVPTAYVSALARASGVPVLLSGDASDELFGGYPAYRTDQILDRYLRVPGLLRTTILNPILERAPVDRVRKLARKASRDADSVRRYLSWMKIIDPDSDMIPNTWGALDAPLRPLLNVPNTRHFVDRIAYTSLRLWVAEDSNMRVDKMTSAMSLEARAPFEDHELVQLALSLPLEYKLTQDDFKVVLKRAFADLIPNEILTRKKWGFTPPMSSWLRTVFMPHVDNYLSREHVREVGIFDPDVVRHIVESHRNPPPTREGGFPYLGTVWSLLVFHMWHALYISGRATLDHKLSPADVVS
jgi:asparagine synthase (glutamine-hydrolysing)